MGLKFSRRFGRRMRVTAMEASMRLLVRGLLLAWAASPALAGDIDNSWLRGSSSFPADPPNYRRWGGFYGGGQIGMDSHSVEFHDTGNAYITRLGTADAILANSGAPPSLNAPERTDARGLSYGGFIGYNYQIDDTVFGLELNLNASRVSVGSSTVRGQNATSITGGNTYQLAVVAQNAVATEFDYGTVRMRGGWAYGSFLPYVVVGAALARIDNVQTATLGY